MFLNTIGFPLDWPKIRPVFRQHGAIAESWRRGCRIIWTIRDFYGCFLVTEEVQPDRGFLRDVSWCIIWWSCSLGKYGTVMIHGFLGLPNFGIFWRRTYATIWKVWWSPKYFQQRCAVATKAWAGHCGIVGQSAFSGNVQLRWAKRKHVGCWDQNPIVWAKKATGGTVCGAAAEYRLPVWFWDIHWWQISNFYSFKSQKCVPA